MIVGKIKEIPLAGLSSTPSDYECQDGEMMVCHNMVGGKGVAEASVLKVGDEEKALPEIGAGGELVFVHNTSFGKVYICVDENKNLKYFNGQSQWKLLPIKKDDTYFVYDIDKDSITHVGNILIVNFHDSSIHYVRYNTLIESQTLGYLYLGDSLPELNIKVDLVACDAIKNNTQSIIGDIVVGEWSPYYSRAHSSDDVRTLSDEESISDYAIGSVNEIIAQGKKEGKFLYPFFVRYAWELYDGSYAKISSPILLIPSSKSNPVVFGVFKKSAPTKLDDIQTKYFPTKIRLTKESYTYLEGWKDIIQNIAIFITPQIIPFNISGTIERRFYDTTWSYESQIENGWLKGYLSQKDLSRGEPSYGIYANEQLIVDPEPHLAKKQGLSGLPVNSLSDYYYSLFAMQKRGGDLSDWVESSYLFYKITSFDPDEIPSWGFRKILDVDVSNLEQQEQLKESYVNRSLIEGKMHTYNNRLNVYDVTVKETPSFSQYIMFSDGEQKKETQFIVNISDGLQHDSTKMNGIIPEFDSMAGFVFYPNMNAKSISIDYNGLKYNITLKRHPFLNGSYAFNGYLGLPVSLGEISTYNSDGFVRPNYIYTSEVDNPFTFPALGVNAIGNGRIKSINSVTKAMSEGTAFGAQPLYVFTEDGIYAMQVNSVGLYDRAAPLSRETVSDASKVLSIDNSVMFLNERGLMELYGSKTRCLSQQLTDKYCSVDMDNLSAKNWNLIEALIGSYGEEYGIACDFMSYIKGNARLAFDYVNYRVYVYSDDEYAYVYDINTKQWSTCASSMHSSVEGFPSTLINIKQYNAAGVWAGTKVCQFSSDDSTLVDGGNVLWLTRPLKFGEHDVLKTVRRIIARGRFSDKSEDLKLALWGSRDMESWTYIGGVQKGVQIPRLSGTPYKYFIVGGCAKLSNEDFISRLTIESSARYVNKPR